MFKDLLKNQIFRYSFLFGIFFLILSFCAYAYPEFNFIAFFIILSVFGVLSFKDLKLGALFIFSELFLNSKGYLFFLEFGGNKISLRIALFVIFVSIYLAKIINNLIEIKISKIRESKNPNFLKNIANIETKKTFEYFTFLKSKYLKYVLVFGSFFLFSIFIGFFNNNFVSNIFFDASGFLFFIYIFPFWDIFKKREDFKDLLYVLLGVSIVVFIQTFFVLWMFSHNKIFYLNDIYRWTKDFGIGEITRFGLSNFYRIFFQSHIYLSSIFVFSISYFIYSLFIKKYKILDFLKDNIVLILFSFISGSTFIISFSRSFWLASILTLIFIFGFIFVLIFIDKDLNLKNKIINFIKISFKTIIFSVVILVFSFYFIKFFINFPKPDVYVNIEDAFSDRVSDPTQESAGSSRINMLNPLFNKIKDNFIFGAGFGTTVVYKTADPTNLSKTVNGMYETFAFEWGYLDLFLKLGIIGFSAYFVLVFVVLKDFILYQLKNDSDLVLFNFGLLSSLVFLLSINLTTPYLNRPVGIGLILIYLMFLNFKNKK